MLASSPVILVICVRIPLAAFGDLAHRMQDFACPFVHGELFGTAYKASCLEQLTWPVVWNSIPTISMHCHLL